MELSFCDLRAKEVVNVPDGRKLGNIIDMVFDTCTGRVTGIVVPCERNFFSIFKTNRDIFIPYHRIRKIGRDIILVEINPSILNTRMSEASPKNKTSVKQSATHTTQSSSYFNVDESIQQSTKLSTQPQPEVEQYQNYYQEQQEQDYYNSYLNDYK